MVTARAFRMHRFLGLGVAAVKGRLRVDGRMILCFLER